MLLECKGINILNPNIKKKLAETMAYSKLIYFEYLKQYYYY